MNNIEEINAKISEKKDEMEVKRLEAIIYAAMPLYNPYRNFHFL